MELKMKYNYSYFIYPYVIKEKNYNKYIQKLLENSKCKLKSFERRRESSIYSYFLPSIRKYIFKSFDFAENDGNPSYSAYDNLRNNMFKASPCTIFEYNLGKNVQAKIGNSDNIFFNIEKMEIICFKTGICFISIKTNIEDTDNFKDLLNFNVKFRSINSEVNESDIYSNIRIQTSALEDTKKLSKIIKEITGSMEEAKKIDVDVNRFLIYSYVCIDREHWNENVPFSGIEKEFNKFANVLDSENNSNLENEKLKIASLGNYIKVGISKAGMTFMASSAKTVNYTKMPFEYESEYFYTYVFTLYQKFYLSKIMNDFSEHIKVLRAIKEFMEFTNEIWVHELTNNENGSLIFENAKEALSLNKAYQLAKEQYDLAYKNFKMKNSEMLNKIILILLAISIITNIVNFVRIAAIKG